MAILSLAMWLQDSDIATTQHLIMIFIGILAVSIALFAIVGAVALLGILKSVKSVTGIVTDLQGKANPIIQEVAAISKHTREVLEDAKPKIRTITDHIVKTSATVSETAVIAKSAVEKVQSTVTDANTRTQRQVARVDGMVSAALNTTAEIVESVNHGIRVPAQKIAQAATQARVIAEGFMERIKGMAGNMPFGGSRQTARPRSAPYGGATPPAGAPYRPASSSPSSSSPGPTSSSSSAGTSYAAAPKTP